MKNNPEGLSDVISDELHPVKKKKKKNLRACDESGLSLMYNGEDREIFFLATACTIFLKASVAASC